MSHRWTLCAAALAAAIALPLRADDNTNMERRLEELEKRVEELSRKPEEQKAASPNAFNPRITILSDFLGTWNPGGVQRDRTGDDRMSLREVEFDIRASIDPFARGVFVGSVGEMTPNEFAFDVEEGYLETTSLPGSLGVKLGRFREYLSPMNRAHTHDLPTPSRPLVHQRFFGEEGLAGTGVSISAGVPNPWDQYVEANVDIVNGDNATVFAGSTSPIPAALGHLKWFGDVTRDSSLELGGSYLHGYADADHRSRQQVYGLDAMWKWKPRGQGLYRSLLLQGEAYWGERQTRDIGTDGSGVDFLNRGAQRPFGWYALAQYQLDRQWYAGVRYDVSEAIADDHNREKAIGAYLSFYTTEFLRFRLGVESHELNQNRNDFQLILFQVTWVFGAHPAEPYWVNR